MTKLNISGNLIQPLLYDNKANTSDITNTKKKSKI